MKVINVGLFLAAILASGLTVAESGSYEGISATPIPIEKRSTTVLGQSYQFPEGVPALYAYNIVIKPGQKTNWHKHAVPLYAYILSGSLTVDYGSKGSRVFEKGMSYIEAIDWCHQGYVSGNEEAVIFGIYMAQVDPNEVKPIPCDGPQ